jgi:hypothetical protein
MSMATNRRRIGPRLRAWLESPSPPATPHLRISLQCPQPQCTTWVFGATEQEATDRLANHHRHVHEDKSRKNESP